MDDSEISFKFPELESELGETDDVHANSLERINEYLDQDIEDQMLLLKRLRDFERKLDAAL